jgi:hypothetical protein
LGQYSVTLLPEKDDANLSIVESGFLLKTERLLDLRFLKLPVQVNGFGHLAGCPFDVGRRITPVRGRSFGAAYPKEGETEHISEVRRDSCDGDLAFQVTHVAPGVYLRRSIGDGSKEISQGEVMPIQVHRCCGIALLLRQQQQFTIATVVPPQPLPAKRGLMRRGFHSLGKRGIDNPPVTPDHKGERSGSPPTPPGLEEIRREKVFYPAAGIGTGSLVPVVFFPSGWPSSIFLVGTWMVKFMGRVRSA